VSDTKADPYGEPGATGCEPDAGAIDPELEKTLQAQQEFRRQTLEAAAARLEAQARAMDEEAVTHAAKKKLAMELGIRARLWRAAAEEVRKVDVRANPPGARSPSQGAGR